MRIVVYRRRSPGTLTWRVWANRFTAVSLAEGLIWGVGAVLMLMPSQAWGQLLVLLVVSAVASNTVAAFGAYLPAVYALFLPAMLSHLVFSAVRGGLMHGVLVVLDLMFILFVGVLALRANRSLVDALELRFRNLRLADELRLQKERAEQASLDKSRFLASASHDLRQPVHALTLFLGALQACQMDNKARDLIGRIDGTVASLDDLFSGLLDISRLDAGKVEVHRKPFPVGPLVERVYRDLAVEARAKGLHLRCRICEAWVDSDPLQLERILRNLATNGVRHTDRGGVLIACRGGDKVRIQVWDTGPGIAPDQQALVFQEFYQVHNPERDRSKGLGLGLAIVRRLTKLLDMPLRLRSVVGRGSVFSLELPAARPVAEATPESATIAPCETPGLVLVIDDEASICDAMAALLPSWGYQVVTAASCDEMLERVDADSIPDLLICDYRLGSGENGIDTIRRMQSRFGRDLPAMLLTGDTAPDRIAAAQASGFVLLHKPVSHVRLRAAIGNLIRGAVRRDG